MSDHHRLLARFRPVLTLAHARRNGKPHPDVEYEIARRERAARGGHVMPATADESVERRRALRGIPVIGQDTGQPADERGDVLDEVLRRERRGRR